MDFNETQRQGAADSGAYVFQSGGNPGWALAEAFKLLAQNGSAPQPPVIHDN